MCFGHLLIQMFALQAELKEKLTKMYDVRDSNGVFVFGFRTQVHKPSS
jgi:hypothetical protein